MALTRVFTLEDEMRRRGEVGRPGPPAPPFPREKMSDELREFLDWERDNPAGGDVSDVREVIRGAVEKWRAAKAAACEHIYGWLAGVALCTKCGEPKEGG